MTKQKEALKLALEALEGIQRYGLDTLSGRVDGPDDREWQRAGVNEMTKRARLGITALRKALAEQPAQQEPEFITHSVDQPYDWSEWVCPNPKGYLMKCCDCGLVHEAEFGVVRYKSETEREDCEPVEDPNLQAVFRMRRSEQWSPEDTAHRAGGMPMEQPTPAEYAMGYAEGFNDGCKPKPSKQPTQQHNATSDHQLMENAQGDLERIKLVQTGVGITLTSQERDAQRWRFLMNNSYDSDSVTQFHVWEHSWEPHSKTGEPTEWKQRVRGIALIDFIDRAIEAAHGIKE